MPTSTTTHTVCIYDDNDTAFFATGTVTEYRNTRQEEYWGTSISIDESEDEVLDLEITDEECNPVCDTLYEQLRSKAEAKLFQYHFQ